MALEPLVLPVFGSRNPYENLSREELIFETFDPRTPLLLLYINGPCVVVGKNQNPWRECAVGRLQEAGIPLVRRITGGGTVWHDEGNLNFSLLVGSSEYSKSGVQEVLSKVLDHLQIPWTSNTHGDFFSRDRKFSGHAYAVKKDRILHHGTLLVAADLPGLKQYLGGEKGLIGPGVASRPSPVINLSEVLPGLTTEKVVAGFYEIFTSGDPRLGEVDPVALSLRRSERSQLPWVLGMTPDFTWDGPEGPLKVESGQVGGEWFALP